MKNSQSLVLDEATAPLLQREVICSDFNHLEEFFFTRHKAENRELWGKQLRCFEAGEGALKRCRGIIPIIMADVGWDQGRKSKKSPAGSTIPELCSQDFHMPGWWHFPSQYGSAGNGMGTPQLGSPGSPQDPRDPKAARTPLLTTLQSWNRVCWHRKRGKQSSSGIPEGWKLSRSSRAAIFGWVPSTFHEQLPASPNF